MVRNYIAGAATVDIFVGDQLLATANTLLDSSITVGSTAEDVRGGAGNKLLGKYYHTSTMDITLTDVLFRLEYLAFNTGSTITQIADFLTQEQVVLDGTKKGTLTGTPAEFKTYGLIGWASLPGEYEYQKVTLSNEDGHYTFQYPGDVQEGQKICIKYVSTDNAARMITISSNFIPSEVSLVMTANLYRAGGKAGAINDSSRVGFVQVEVPRFQFSASQEISMTSTGVANTPLTGSALDNPSEDCSGNGYYAKITEVIEGANWYDNVFTLAVDDADINIAPAGTYNMTVYAIPTNGSAFVAPVADLTFTSGNDSFATVGANTGVITGVADGETTVTVVITAKPTVEAVASVTVATA